MSETTIALGLRVRSLRKERNLSQRELADLSSLSPNAISLIERDVISPSVATLQRLAAALGVKMSYFFENDSVARVLHFRPHERPAIRGAGFSIEGLGARLEGQHLEPFYITLAPHSDMGAGHVTHEGHEFVCCLGGVLRYEIDGEVYALGPGDFLLFEADLPHRWGNPSDDETQAVLVLQAPNNVDEPARRHFPAYPSVTHLG